MRRRVKLFLGCGVALAVLSIAVLLVMQSEWFSRAVRDRIAHEAARLTGGRVEIGSFRFEWRTMRIELANLVIHGSEPAGSPPLLRVASLAFTLKPARLLKGTVDMDGFEAIQPKFHLLIDPSGQTNLPGPEPQGRGGQLFDVVIRRFLVRDGEFDVNSSRNPWSAKGANFRTVFHQQSASRYEGTVSIEPLEITLSQDLPITLHVQSTCTVAKNQIIISHTTLDTAESHAELSGAIHDLANPQSDFQYNVHFSLAEVSRVLKVRARQKGIIHMEGTGHFAGAADYVANGRLRATELSFGEGARAVTGVTADSAVRIDPLRVELTGLRMEALGGSFTGQAEVTALDRFRLNGDVVGLDLARLVSLYGSRPVPWGGMLAGSVDIRGLLSQLYLRRFQAKAQIVISPAGEHNPVHGAIEASYDGERGLLDLADSHLALPSTQLDFAGVLGRQLRVRLKSTNLEDVAPAFTAPLPIRLDHGSASFDGTVTGGLDSPQIVGRVSLSNFVYDQQKFQAFTADATVDESSVHLESAILKHRGWQVELDGKAGLADWHFHRDAAVEAKISAQGTSFSEVAALAGRNGIPVEGGFRANGRISGFAQEPRIEGDLSLTKGTLYGEPFDRLTVKLQYAANRLQIGSGAMEAGPKRVRFDGTYQHAAGDFTSGRLALHATGNRMALNQIQTVRDRWPELTGDVQFTAGGTFDVTPAKTRAEEITADLSGFAVAMQGKSLGDVRLTAATRNGALEAKLEMPLAGSAVHAEGRWRMEGDYPGTVEASFSRLDFAKLAAFADVPPALRNVNGWTEGKLTLTGPALEPAAWTGSLDLPKIEIVPAADPAAPGSASVFALRNAAPVHLTLAQSLIRVESAHLAGRNTDFSLTGTAALADPHVLDARVEGTVDAALLRDFTAGATGSGQVVIDAAIRGPIRQPQIAGRMNIKNASLTFTDFPNGLTQINGAILFEGTRATIRDVTAETGGGKVTLSGFVSVAANEPRFRIDATAAQVRLRYPEGASTVADAALTWTGSSQRNVLAGTVTILRTGLNRRTDFSSLFGHAAEPSRTVANPTGLLAGLQFDVQIETAPGVSFQTSLAQNLQADANLRLRGTLANPVLLGRINITQGEMTFFGNKYTISQGSVSFFNPVKLEPNLNLDLQTRARGIDITLSVSGPINKLTVNYRSDPPLQFSDIVALLATGRAPSTDPAVLARQSGAAQSWQQAGASSLVSQAISSPGGGGRLERFFGVSKIKIDPLLTAVDNNPQAHLTIEQPVTQDVTLTYITNLTRTNSAFVRVEWSLNREWSVIAVREENSAFGLDLQFKKRFK